MSMNESLDRTAALRILQNVCISSGKTLEQDLSLLSDATLAAIRTRQFGAAKWICSQCTNLTNALENALVAEVHADQENIPSREDTRKLRGVQSAQAHAEQIIAILKAQLLQLQKELRNDLLFYQLVSNHFPIDPTMTIN